MNKFDIDLREAIEAFLGHIFKEYTIKWDGIRGYHNSLTRGSDLVAVLELRKSEEWRHTYDALVVSIRSSSKGLIDSTTFVFRDYLESNCIIHPSYLEESGTGYKELPGYIKWEHDISDANLESFTKTVMVYANRWP